MILGEHIGRPVGFWRPVLRGPLVHGLKRRMRLLIQSAVALNALLGDETRIRDWLLRRLRPAVSRTPPEAMSTLIEWIRGPREVALRSTS